MEFRILGPLEVVDDGRTVDVGAAKQRALLAALLLETNRVVSSDRLIAALWGETAPETATKALQVYVSQLRKVLGRERIVTRAPGYELRVAPGELDLDRFHELVFEGKLDEALRLWRGSPLADFAYEPFAQAEIARLEELQLACLEERLQRDLARGRHGALVGELEALVREHPLRERLRARLMLALYRSGRQAEALDAYQVGRALLSDELGLEPGAELKELQRAILAHDPSLVLAREVEPAPPPPELTEDAHTAPRRAREVRKTVTVLACDVTASDPGLDPESLRRMTTRGLEELVPVLERHGATVERSIGGLVTAIFGVPTVHEDDAYRAARAAVEMRELLAALRDELEGRWRGWLEVRAGIGTGEVLTGGDDGGRFATGAPVESALALQRTAAAGELLLDERTYRLVRDAVDAERVEGHVALLGVRATGPGYETRFDSPMVGRDRERRRLRDAFEEAIAARSCQLFTILGAPGVGKSRLVQELVADLPDDAAVARGRCLPYGEGITYWPVVEAVRDAAGLEDGESAEESMEKLAALLAGEDEAALAAQRLGEVVGLTEEQSGADEAFWAVRTFFEALARRQALVVVFDDIHWGEPTFLDLIDHIADWTRDAPVLLLCVARPELLEVRPHWGGGKLNSTSALLEPLSDAESEQLVANLTATVELEEPERRRIVDAAGGNPLFVEEMLALVLEEEDAATSLEVPPTIQALLAARLDRLANDERAVIEAAAVEGKVFHEGSVSALLRTSAADVHHQLLTLVRRELIRLDRTVFSGDRGYRFRHLLIRDAAYDSIPKESRAALHECHAAWLEGKAGDRALEFEEILGYHLEQAFRYHSELGPADEAAVALGKRAAERLGVAGRRAFARADTPAAMNLISRAVSLLPADDPLRVDLIPSVRAIQGFDGDLSWADRALREAIQAGDDRLKARALVQRGFLQLFTEDVSAEELLSTAQDAMVIAGRVGDELLLARAWRLAGQAHYLARHATPGLDAGERALEHARAAGDRFEVMEVVEWLLVLLLFGPSPAGAAIDRCRSLLSEVAEDPAVEAMTRVSMAWFEAARGRAVEAERLLGETRRAMEGHGEVIPFVLFYGGLALILLDELEAAASDFQESFEFLRMRGRTGHYGAAALGLAEVRYVQGRYDEVDELIDEAYRAIRPNDVWDRVHCDTARAKVLARRGDFEVAERLAREAVDFVSQSDFLTAQADATSDLAEVLRLAGRYEAAARALVEAIELHDRKGNVVAVERARVALETIGAP